MKMAYKYFNFHKKTLEIIVIANNIIEEYKNQGYALTLRQLYYQFVARGYLDNKQKNYAKLGSIINDARLAGMVDWNAIEDRTRNLRGITHWDSPSDIIEAAVSSYHIDRWQNQDSEVEVWIEKDALVGVIERVCASFDVSFFSCRGYVSQSEMWRAAQRHLYYEQNNKKVILLHLGDHDPSGLDMTRDIQERLYMFGTDTHVDRIALNMDQIEELNPPPNPAKITDSRFIKYLDEYGSKSWELDALEPQYISNLIEKKVKSIINISKWEEMKNKEINERNLLSEMAEKLGE